MREELVKTEDRPIVRSAGNVIEALAEYQRIQKGLDTAMPKAIIKVAGKPFRKKPYWRAIATAFNLDAVMTSEQVIRDPKNSDEWVYVVTYKATAPNGRAADGDGSCSSSEKTIQQRTVHNVRSHAHTRAFNRAVSNLVGFGEVSAEEVDHTNGREIPPEVQQTDPGELLVEDDPPPPTTKPDDEYPKGPVDTSKVISTKQVSRLWGIAYGAAKENGATGDDAKDMVRGLLEGYGYAETKEVRVEHYDTICQKLERWGRKT